MSQTQTYIEFFYSGAFVAETSVEEVTSRDVASVNVPNGAFMFMFFDVKSAQEGEVPMQSDRLNISPRYYYGGRIMTQAEVRSEMPEDQTLMSNIEDNGWDRVIQCRTGNFQPFESGDIYIEAK